MSAFERFWSGCPSINIKKIMSKTLLRPFLVRFMIIIFFLLSWLIGSQISNIADDWPTIKDKASLKLNNLSEWANQRLNWDYQNYIENNKRLVQKAEGLASSFLSSVMNLLSQSLIVFVYVVLLLLQKNMFIDFFKKLSSNPAAMTSILKGSSKIISRYLLGKGKIMIFLFEKLII